MDSGDFGPGNNCFFKKDRELKINLAKAPVVVRVEIGNLCVF